ncbi:MAG: hypothetical protein L0K08_05470 [Bifidobacterium mongoliense]|uniref:hypothetical protein n=1 Tax=Bifidobacterium crudilactis TaxID=327277 RepID=UPI00264804D4|nr:hypothetical protein [Bifidobacterium crudilactis]MDN6485504.1 hypothetical protein [Bifidobacterium mongoliense]MDN6805430.1 hypothetical protein [Bifidobacterium crudilactis]
MIQSTAAIYDDGSATLTVNGHRRKIRERDAQAARAMILTILVRDAATLKEDHALNVMESDGRRHFVIHPDGSLTDTQQAGQPANPSTLTATRPADAASAIEPVAPPRPLPVEVAQPINEATTQQLEPVAAHIDEPAPTLAPAPARVMHLPSISRTALVKAGIILAGILVLVAASTGGLHAWHSSQHQQAIQSCESAIQSQTDAASALSKSHAQAAELADMQAGQLTNPSTLTTLKQAQARHTKPLTAVCSTTLTTTHLNDLTQQITHATKTMKADAASINAAARAVVVSRDAKVLADAKASLAQAIKDAQGTLDSSNGKVADDKTREALQKALDAANKVLADSSVKDQKRYQGAKASLAAPVKSVNDSVAAKTAADKAAADAAAAQAAQAQAQSQSRSSSGSSSSGSSSSKRSSSSGSSGSPTRRSTGGTSGSTNTNQSNNSPSWSVPSSGSDEGNIGGSDPGL